MLKVTVLPYPAGKEFAVTFVDDPDLSTRENTEAVYDLLKSCGIKGTKAVWVYPAKRTSTFHSGNKIKGSLKIPDEKTLEDADYLNYVLDLRKQGFEIALHNIAAGNSTRQEIIEGIAKFKHIFGEFPKINTLHSRNVENLYAGAAKLDLWFFEILERIIDGSKYMGHEEGSPYFWGDVAKECIKYTRLPFHTISDINTLKINPSMPFHDAKRPYVKYWFASSDGSNCKQFNTLLSERNLRKLEKEYGACLVYTHYAKGFCRKGNGKYVLDEKFKETILNLKTYKNAWYPTASGLLDRLLLFKNILVMTKDNKILVTNIGKGNINKITLKLNINDYPIIMKNKDENLELAEEGKVIIDRLQGGETIEIHTKSREKIKIKNINKIEISKKERIGIEIHNYCGMIRNEIIPKIFKTSTLMRR